MKVSLIIPAYNVEKLIEMTLESVENQTLKDFECIIVNDFSTDNTFEVIKNYIRNRPGFRLVSHRANAGLSAARNTGIRFARGEYIAFLDADDLIMPESLELRAKTLDTVRDNDSVIGTYAGSITIDMNCKVPPIGKEIKLKKIDFITAGGNCPFNANQPMFKTKLFKNLGGFDHSLKQAEDYDMWMRLLRYGYSIIPTNKQLVTYRQTEGSMIRDNPLLHLSNSYKNFHSCYQNYCENRFTSKITKHLKKSLADYTAELNIANRVLEFVGIALAKGDDLKLLEDKLVEYLPNYFDIVEQHRPFENRIKKGIDRYYKKNVNLNDEEFKVLNKKIKTLYKHFKDASQKRKTEYSMAKSIKYNFENIVQYPGIQREIDLVFFPHKDYHVYTISLLKDYFEKLSLKIIIVDISMHYRDERAKDACTQYNLPMIGYSNFLMGDFRPKAIVVFNDWDPIVRSIVLAAKKNKIPTVGIVEGIQDYLDADTKQDRKTYKTVEYLFLPGEHDKKYFPEKCNKMYVGGIPRIYDLYNNRRQHHRTKEKTALINSNFSYGVLEEYRDEWVESAVEACKKAGYTPVISRHPADKGKLYPELTTQESFYEALEKSSVLVSRFASGILEALAMNVLPIYFNPHKEKVDKFFNPLGAYPIANSEKELVDTLKTIEDKIELYQQNFKKFLEFHAGSLENNNSRFIAEKLYEIVQKNKLIPTKNYEKFYNEMYTIDLKSGCFNNLQTVRMINSTLLEQLDNNINKLSDIAKIHVCLKEKKYLEAMKVAEKLLDKSPDNPSYKSLFATVELFLKLK